MGGWVGMPFQGSIAGLQDNINYLASPGYFCLEGEGW